MKKLAHAVLSIFLPVLLTVGIPQVTEAAEFFCFSGDVTCLIAAINNANGMPGAHVINLEPGSYTLQTIDNGQSVNANGLPVIRSSIRIHGSADDLPTVHCLRCE
jgi:hypothetical protein